MMMRVGGDVVVISWRWKWRWKCADDWHGQVWGGGEGKGKHTHGESGALALVDLLPRLGSVGSKVPKSRTVADISVSSIS